MKIYFGYIWNLRFAALYHYCCCCLVLLLFSFLSKVFSFLTGLSSLLGASGFGCLTLPVRVCSLECNNNNSIARKS